MNFLLFWFTEDRHVLPLVAEFIPETGRTGSDSVEIHVTDY